MIAVLLRRVQSLDWHTAPRVWMLRRPRVIWREAWLRPALLVLGLILAAATVALEMRTSMLQSLLFSWRASRMVYTVDAGPSPAIEFPRGGPHDERLGYRRLPEFIDRLRSRGYRIERQARMAPAMQQHVAEEGYAIYREKHVSGLQLQGRDGGLLFQRQYPHRAFYEHEAIPRLVSESLLFIEDRELLDAARPRRNPAVNWQRLALAVAGRVGSWIDRDLYQGGASTLATQIEKIRHSPGGRTVSGAEKLKQMMAASLRSYLDGGNNWQARQRIVATYLDSLPLGGRAGHGEVIGIGSGLWAWFGTDLGDAAAALAQPIASGAALREQARHYKQVLGLLLATRRPAAYLREDAEALNALANRYLPALERAGIIDAKLRDAALATPLSFVPQAPPAHDLSQPAYKAAYRLRVQLLEALGIDRLTVLDRLDLAAESTLDTATQQRVATALRRLADEQYVRQLGLVGPKLLDGQGLDRIVYGIVLYEAGDDRNRLRLRADSHDGAFDFNAGGKLGLGSSAKLRTLLTYLNIIAELHTQMVRMPQAELRRIAGSNADSLTRWAATYLASARDDALQPMLDAAMQRRYSASPWETFFTGGGEHVFHNYKKSENREQPSVEQAFRRSMNLPFVRLLRDVVDYHIATGEGPGRAVLEDPMHPARQHYLIRFADREGLDFLSRWYPQYRALGPDAILRRVGERAHARAVPLAVAFRSVRPGGGPAELATFLRTHMGREAPNDEIVAELHRRYAVERYDLPDRGYLSGVHPLELWMAAYLHDRPQAAFEEIARESLLLRQQVYEWLFESRNVRAQNARIRILLEEDAFRAIHADWQRQGYPFERLVPSLATALGSSGDRPDALADLVGIVLNGGVRLPTAEIEALHFARETPYETRMAWTPPIAERVLAPEVAESARRALQGVVDGGTAARLHGVFRDAECKVLHVGGKTGTSDERAKSFDARGRLVAERYVARSATFVFFLGDRFFGTVTAHVQGEQAEHYGFTSSMVVQLLRGLAPELSGLVGAAPADSLGECATVAARETAAG